MSQFEDDYDYLRNILVRFFKALFYAVVLIASVGIIVGLIGNLFF